MQEYDFYEDYRHEYDGWDDAPLDPLADDELEVEVELYDPEDDQ
jgi:hypothetical protein